MENAAIAVTIRQLRSEYTREQFTQMCHDYVKKPVACRLVRQTIGHGMTVMISCTDICLQKISIRIFIWYLNLLCQNHYEELMLFFFRKIRYCHLNLKRKIRC